MSETIEFMPLARPLRHPVEYIGQLVRLGYSLHVATTEGARSVESGDVLIVRPPGGLWRTGHAVITSINLYNDMSRTIIALAEGDHVYRLGAPLTPSLDDRVAAIESLLGIALDDLEVAGDAELEGGRDVAAEIRARAVARIRGAR